MQEYKIFLPLRHFQHFHIEITVPRGHSLGNDKVKCIRHRHIMFSRAIKTNKLTERKVLQARTHIRLTLCLWLRKSILKTRTQNNDHCEHLTLTRPIENCRKISIFLFSPSQSSVGFHIAIARLCKRIYMNGKENVQKKNIINFKCCEHKKIFSEIKSRYHYVIEQRQ